MKKLCLVMFVIAQILNAQSKEKLINNFLNTLKKNDIIQYSLKYSFNDESKGKRESNVNCAEIIVPEDTIIGAYYNFASKDGSQSIYAGKEYYYYFPDYYGYGIVELITKKKNPDRFTDIPINVDGMVGYHPSIVKASSFNNTSIANFRKLLSDKNILSNIQYLKDTVINNIDCYRIKIDYELIALDKKTYLPVYYLMDARVQQTEAYYSDFKINSASKKSLFSRAAFPKNFKFSSNVKVKDTRLREGTVAPDFEVISTKDKKIKLSDLKGKFILMFVTEIGCPPCMQAIPDINQITKDFKELVVLGLYPLDSKDALLKLIKDKNIIFDVFPKAKDVKEKYGVQGFPNFFIIDPTGMIAYSHSGYYVGKKVDFLFKDIKKIMNK